MAAQASIVLVKIGGSTLGAQDTAIADVAALAKQGRRPIVVHGGGAMISDWLARLGVRAEFVDGLRVTDEASLEVVAGVLAGAVNKRLVQQLTAAGALASGISGADGGLLTGRVDRPELGRVAASVEVDPAPLLRLLDDGCVPVVAPLALERADGRGLLNVNADTAAGAIAAAAGAERLVFLTDVDGVLDASGRLLRRVAPEEAERLIADGVIAGGMIPKARACLAASEAGAPGHVVNGTRPNALLRCLDGAETGTAIG